MCDSEVASWIPDALAATLRSERSAKSVIAWLAYIRDSIEEYDPLITVRPVSPESVASEASSVSPDSAFDEILSQLGKEIYKLDEYQRNLAPSEKEVSLSILNIFDECLERMKADKATQVEFENFQNGDCSDCESTLSDVSFVTSTPSRCVKGTDINAIFDNGDGTPVPPRRVKLKSTSSSVYDMEVKTIQKGSDSDSESTCWSYKECSACENDSKETYAAMWAHSTGFHNSDEILRRVLSQNHATISRLSYDTTSELEANEYTVYALHEVGDSRDRCDTQSVVNMTPDKPIDDGYEPVRDAITDENIYEEIEYGCYTDEGCSCGTSVEVESCSISASSEGVDRDSPVYANLTDNNAYAVPANVIFWKNLLLHPFYNDDEEDEWITPEECAVYAREQRPPLVIPRITQYRPQRREYRERPYMEENIPEQGSLKSQRQYERVPNWSPGSERSRVDLERSFNKANSDSPPFIRLNKRLGGSTENLLHPNVRRPNNLHLPASSSGDSLDLEIRNHDHERGYARSRKSRSMVASKQRVLSPVPAPRMLIQPHSSESSVILEGPVKRTKYYESGKKCKKNWTECYMVLKTTELCFYKDHKTYYAAKLPRHPGTPPSPTTPHQEVLPLRKLRVFPCQPTYTRRYTRSLILSVDADQYLIQDDTEEGARRWLQTFEKVICSLWSALPADQYQSSNTDLESLGRTPPTSRHVNKANKKAGGSSNEDLSDGTEASIQRSAVKSRLRKFFAKRPSVEVLVNKGIYKDEPVFGRKLEEVCPSTSPRVPLFVHDCIKQIEKNEDNMCTDGLYRASGNLSQVQKIRLEIDQNNRAAIENSSDVHVLTGSLKLFFRELKEPLIPYSMYERVLAACSMKPREAKIKEFRDIVQSLPQCNRDTLKFLLEHLLRVTERSERNRMHTANLAIVFGPTLLWPSPEPTPRNVAVDCIQQNNVVEILLNEFSEIFDDNNAKKKA